MHVTVVDAREYEGDLDATKSVWLVDQGLNLKSYSFYFEGGLKSFVAYYNQTQKPVQKNIFYVEKDVEDAGDSGQDVNVEIAFQYVDDIQPRLVTFANNIYTPEGGMHLTGFKTALTRTLNSYARDNKLLKDKDDNFSDSTHPYQTKVLDCNQNLIAIGFLLWENKSCYFQPSKVFI